MTSSRRLLALAAVSVALLALPVTTASQSSSRPSPPVLAQNWPAATLGEVLLSRAAWKPVPSIADRAGWAAVPDGLKMRILAEGEKALKTPIPELPASLFLEYTRTGNRTHFEDAMFKRRDRLHDLVLAECLEDKGRFLDAIVNTAWAIAEESSWTIPAHQTSQKAKGGLPDVEEPIVDLFAAQTAHSIAWTLYLMNDRLDTISPIVRTRLSREVDRRVLTPFFTRDDFWWMGFGTRADRPNNWNPWINSNVIAAALLVEANGGRRAAIVHKALRSLDKFLGPYPTDGSCDEGPAYWTRAGASLFEALELLQSASAGKINEFGDPVIANMGKFTYRARIAGTWVVDVGDSDPHVTPDRALAYRYGVAINDPLLRAFGASGATDKDAALNDRSIGRALFTIFGWNALMAEREAPAPLPRDVWLPSDDMQLMTARDRAGSTDGLFVAAWGAHNNQSHNHNDVGNAIVFADGTPVLIDVGRPEYTAQTFSSKRYEIWAMQSQFHNLPTINGLDQYDGRAAAATNVTYTMTDAAASLTLDIAKAYTPAAGVQSWIRGVTLNRRRNVTITDRASLAAASKDVTLNLMTPCDVAVTQPGELRFTCSSAGHAPVIVTARYSAAEQTATIERKAIDDTLLKRAWGDHLNRIRLTAATAAAKIDWTLTLSK